METYPIVGQKHRGVDTYLPGILPGNEVALVRDPNNEYDKNCVMVLLKIDGIYEHVGFIPKDQNKQLAELIDKTGHEFLQLDGSRRKHVIAKFARNNKAYPMVEVDSI